MSISAGEFPAGVLCPSGTRRPLPRGSGSVRLQSEHFGTVVIHSDMLCILRETTVSEAVGTCLAPEPSSPT